MHLRAITVVSVALVGIAVFGIGPSYATSASPTACMIFNVTDAQIFLGPGVVLGMSPENATPRTSSCVLGIPTTSNAFTGPLSPSITITAQKGPRKTFADALGPRSSDSTLNTTRVQLEDQGTGSHGPQTAWYTARPSDEDGVLVMYRKGQLWSVRSRGTADDFATAKAVMQMLIRRLPIVITGD
jgi:hypothetical protein